MKKFRNAQMEAAEYTPLSGNAVISSANYQEYFLQGSILDSEIHKLLDRLQGEITLSVS